MRFAALFWLCRRSALDPNGKAVDGAHLFVLERGGIAKVIEHHVEGVMAPEEFVADQESRDAEYAVGDGPIGILAQLLLHLGFIQRALRIVDAQLRSGHPL